MQIIVMNILKVTDGIIAHQVNCRGKMGKGLAESIKITFPPVFTAYCRATGDKGNSGLLGKIQLCRVSSKVWVANLFAQNFYGTDRRQTDYRALEQCLLKLAGVAEQHQLQVYLPYKLGCNNAGGEWSVVLAMIERVIPKAIICQWHSK